MEQEGGVVDLHDENVDPSQTGKKPFCLMNCCADVSCFVYAADHNTLLRTGCWGLKIMKKPSDVRIEVYGCDTVVKDDQTLERLPDCVVLVFLEPGEVQQKVLRLFQTVSPEKPLFVGSGRKRILSKLDTPEQMAGRLAWHSYTRHTYERLALALILLGPDYLEEMVDAMENSYQTVFFCTIPKEKQQTVKETALLVLENHKSGWTSAQLINGSAHKPTIGGFPVPTPCIKASPEERAREILLLCLENSHERLALTGKLLGSEYIWVLDGWTADHPGVPGDVIGEMNDAAMELFEKWGSVTHIDIIPTLFPRSGR